MIGEISHFQVLEKIGEGGMGLVYRARDDRLDRDVAIKVLPEAVSQDPDRLRRFEREARSAGSLNHPNILTVYDIGEHDGRPYIVTELLVGDTLHAAIPRKGLPLEKAVALAMQIASGLAAAHENGIVHRDLKPSNLFVTRDGHLKILDFGLAKLKLRTEPDSETAVLTEDSTASGTILGTIGYMSPEQVRGLSIDERSDIFSFGCVLHEMLSGKRAFTGSTPADVISAVLSEQPEDTAVVNPEVPEELARLVQRCLEKRPEDRFQSARDVLHALEDLSVARRLPTAHPFRARWLTRRRTAFVGSGLVIAAVAVVSLWQPAPLLGFSERDWILVSDFGHPEGETELAGALKLALTVGLQESGYINVVNRRQIADVLQMMERPPDTAIDAAVGLEVCQRASLKGLLVPEVARLGSGYIVTAKVVEPVSEATVASFSARSENEDGLLDALDELLSNLRDGLGDLASPGTEERPLAAVTTGSLDALKSYTQGLRAWNAGRYGDAVEHYRNAVAIDPDFASAYSALGSAYSSFVLREHELAAENFTAALARLDRVGRRELNFIRSQHAAFLGRLDEQIRFLRLHLADYPDDPSAHFNLGISYRKLGRYEQCVTEYEEVLRVAPHNAAAMINLATCLSAMGEDEAAIARYREAFEIQPEWETASNSNHEYGVTLMNAGLFSEAREVFEKRLARPEAGHRGQAHRSLGHLDLYRGQFAAAEDHFRQAASLHAAAGHPLSEARDLIFQAYSEVLRADDGGAAETLARSEEIMPTDAGSISFHTNLGIAYLAAGEVEAARRVSDRLKESIRVDDDQTGEETRRQFRILEARVLLAEGEIERALEMLESEAHVSTRPNADLVAGLADAYEAREQWMEYEEALRRLIEMRWDSYEGLVPWITAHYRLAEVSEKLGKREEALASYRRFLELWGDTDSELPRVESARHRLQSLGA